MPRTRPYFVRIGDKTRMVEATSKEAAIGHCTRPLIQECRVASNSDVAAFARGGGTIEVQGEYPEAKSAIQVGDVVLELASGVAGQPGARLMKDGDTYRLATDSDPAKETVLVPEGARLEGNVLFWRPEAEHKAPDAAIAHDGHNVQRAGDSTAAVGGTKK